MCSCFFIRQKRLQTHFKLYHVKLQINLGLLNLVMRSIGYGMKIPPLVIVSSFTISPKIVPRRIKAPTSDILIFYICYFGARRRYSLLETVLPIYIASSRKEVEISSLSFYIYRLNQGLLVKDPVRTSIQFTGRLVSKTSSIQVLKSTIFNDIGAFTIMCAAV